MAYTKDPLTPSYVNKYIKNILEKDLHLKQLYIIGEASNVKYHSNGNIYFSIKDEQGQINCIMFKSYASKHDFRFIDGDKIEILASVYTYIKMGQYNLNVIKVRKTGTGDLYQKFLELKNELEAKGYFKEQHKLQIPLFPQKIGVITSPTGAAIKDVITTIKRRYPLCKIVVIPTLVQGEKAKDDIVKNINRANQMDFDLLIVGRGGGSIEDLWAFNEMIVAEAIYESLIPIISAVGHETDFTIADFVADKRAPTPTGAAEIATPDINILKQKINKNINFLKQDLNNKIKLEETKLNNLYNNQYFQNPLLNLEMELQNYNEQIKFKAKLLKNQIQTKEEQLQNNINLIKDKILQQIEQLKLKNNHQKDNLDNLNPLSILSKGYATVQKEGQIIKSIKNIKKGDEININLIDGEINATINTLRSKNEKK